VLYDSSGHVLAHLILGIIRRVSHCLFRVVSSVADSIGNGMGGVANLFSHGLTLSIHMMIRIVMNLGEIFLHNGVVVALRINVRVGMFCMDIMIIMVASMPMFTSDRIFGAFESCLGLVHGLFQNVLVVARGHEYLFLGRLDL
jgi:hypothetical protein